MLDAGLIVLTAFISPFRSERRMARDLLGAGEFFEVHVDTPLAVAEARDVKGLYAKARAGTLSNFTGIDSPYEAPEQPEIVVDTASMTPEAAAEMIVDRLRDGGYLRADQGFADGGGGLISPPCLRSKWGGGAALLERRDGGGRRDLSSEEPGRPIRCRPPPSPRRRGSDPPPHSLRKQGGDRRPNPLDTPNS